MSTFRNPIGDGADPWVIFFNEQYYLVQRGSSNNIVIRRASKLHDVAKAPAVSVWSAPPNTNYSHEIWAPELHNIDGKWYIYFAADDGKNENHRMFVIEGDREDPICSYKLKPQITSTQSIDGTILTLHDGTRYFVWSGAPAGVNPQHLYISKMSNPWTLVGETVEISRPEYEWEKSAAWVNEGPTVLKKNEKIHLVYSASACFGEYCYGLLTLVGNNPLDKSSWLKKSKPVFSGTETVWGPGHGNFTTSPDGTEDWMIYHCKKTNGFTSDRQLCIQKFSWNEDDTPNFGEPVPLHIDIDEASNHRNM